MIATDRFVFLHLHKSGGTFINRCLLEFLPDARHLGYHLPRAELPPALRSLPLLGSVRNPWDYYVSWFSFQSAMATPNPLFLLASDDRRLDFSGTVENLLTLADSPARIERLRAQLPGNFVGRGLNLTRSCLDPLEGSGLGFYSFLYRRMYGDAQDVVLIRTTELRQGLLDFLASKQVAVSQKMREAVSLGRALNSSEHRHYSSYYDDRLRNLVAERDGALIARHDFRFEAMAG